ncbi:Flp family type IVb pilin [Pseudarthrobacter phenanthrenivorans]|uniref:Flp family type IVb pilin n=1 Tax=Pseudarthrobacter phenanthrenivorans TaxID=361575 RepID=UPI001FE59A1C|nr:Flp family type IVb pilin [Pseudarthrobacter phenanthrenivorans]
MTSLMVSMTAFIAGVKDRLREEKGATMVEYGIMVAFIAVLVLAVVIVLGPQIAAMFQEVSDSLPAAPAAP